MQKQLTWRQAIDRVLAGSSRPLHYQEITERIIADGLRQNLGATPAATVNAQISASIKKHGPSSPYVRVAKGTFALARTAAAAAPPTRASSGAVAASEESEQECALVTSFGMFWRRDAVEWTAAPRLWGMQHLGATPVDFNQQRGVYLLYDGREVIYVGRTTDRPLGKRLYEHTLDRMSARWDRFSWFGLLPISATGALGRPPKTFAAEMLTPALEAILVEALEPRQNRKRGDDLAAVEYIQHEDPEIKKRRVKAAFDEALRGR